MYMNERGATVLDYSGVVVTVTPAELWPRLEIRYRDGQTRTTSAHPDFVIPMAAPSSGLAESGRRPRTRPPPPKPSPRSCSPRGTRSRCTSSSGRVGARFDPDSLSDATADDFVPVRADHGHL